MAIIDIILKKEYLTGLSLIILNLKIIFSFFDFSDFKLFKRVLITTFFMIVFHYLCCIFLESEVNIHFLKIYQIQLEKVISYLSLITSVSAFLNLDFGAYFYYEYINYKMFCPFTLDKLDYKLHFKRRCQLYNIDQENYYPFQYICSYNPEKNQINTIFSEKDSISRYSEFRCSKVEILIKNNQFIDDFVKEYYKEDIYYCNFKKQINNFYESINPRLCGTSMFYPEVILILVLFLVISFILFNFTYFRNIKANINVRPYIAL